MQLRYNFRLYPTPGSARALARAFGCARVVFNDALRARGTAREAGLAVPDGRGPVQAVITEAKKTPERAWLGEVSAVVLQQSLADLNTAYRNFFASIIGKRKGRKMAAPRFRSRKDNRQADPVHHERPVQGAPQRAAAAAEDRRRAGALVPRAALRPVHGDGGQGRGRPVLRVVRRRDRPTSRCPTWTGGRHRPGPDPLRGPLRRHEDRRPAVPAPGREEAQAGAAGPVPQAAGPATTGTRPASRSPALTRGWPTRGGTGTTSSPRRSSARTKRCTWRTWR